MRAGLTNVFRLIIGTPPIPIGSIRADGTPRRLNRAPCRCERMFRTTLAAGYLFLMTLLTFRPPQTEHVARKQPTADRQIQDYIYRRGPYTRLGGMQWRRPVSPRDTRHVARRYCFRTKRSSSHYTGLKGRYKKKQRPIHGSRPVFFFELPVHRTGMSTDDQPFTWRQGRLQ